MRMFKWALAGAGGVAVAGIIAVTALGLGVSQAEEPGGNGDNNPRTGAFTEALADRLGLSVSELNEQRTAALDDVLAEAVASGRLTQEQADKIKEGPMRHAGGPGRGFGKGLHGAIGDIFGSAAETLGLTKDELRTELMEGKSLADILAEQNVSVDELKASILDAVEAKLDAAVAEGKLSQDQADTLKEKLDEGVDKFVENGPLSERRK